MEIQYIVSNLINDKLEQSIASKSQEMLRNIADTFDTVKFLGLCENPANSCLIGVVEFNQTRYPVALNCFRKLQIESLRDFSDIKNRELTVYKDGDNLFFELA